MLIFNSCGLYITSAKTLKEKIERIDQIITALEIAMLNAASDPSLSTFSAYQLDTGQSKIQTQYRSVEQMAGGIEAFQRIKNNYVNQVNGHSFRLLDSKNFKPRR